MKRFRIYDNGGKTLDRYTIAIREKHSNEVSFWGCSNNPYTGVGGYAGGTSDGYTGGAHMGKKLKAIPESIAGYFEQCARSCGWDYHGDNVTDNIT